MESALAKTCVSAGARTLERQKEAGIYTNAWVPCANVFLTMQITFDLLRHHSKFPIYALCDEIVEICASRTTWSGEPCAMHSGRHLLCIGRKEYVKLL
jgi:hypothetical protein